MTDLPPDPAAFRVTPPEPGTVLLACRCGAVLDAADMHRRPRPKNTGAAPLIDPIVCARCAA